MKKDKCFNCENRGTDFLGYTICDSCKKGLRLFTEKTVAKYVNKYSKLTYENDIKDRLVSMENVYIKQRIKLLDILEKISK